MKLIAKIATIAFMFFLSACIKEEPTVSFSPFEQDIYERINAYRLVNDLPELIPSVPVQEQATNHATAMANGDIPFSNDGFSERALAIKTAIRGNNVVEHLAKEISTSAEVIDFWRQNEDSNADLLGDFNLVGICSKQSETDVYYHVLILFRTN